MEGEGEAGVVPAPRAILLSPLHPRTFPIASRPLSKKNMMPRTVKRTPKPVRPTPISDFVVKGGGEVGRGVERAAAKKMVRCAFACVTAPCVRLSSLPKRVSLERTAPVVHHDVMLG